MKGEWRGENNKVEKKIYGVSGKKRDYVNDSIEWMRENIWRKKIIEKGRIWKRDEVEWKRKNNIEERCKNGVKEIKQEEEMIKKEEWKDRESGRENKGDKIMGVGEWRRKDKEKESERGVGNGR